MHAKEKTIVKNTLTDLPEDEKDVFLGFTQVSAHDIYDVVTTQITRDPILKKIKPGEYLFGDLLSELNKLKDELGGSPTFHKKTPTIDDKDSHKKFLGIPLSAVKDWFRRSLDKAWTPTFFWKNLAKQFNVTKNGLSKYEDIHIRIQRFGLLIANKERFQEILDKKERSRYGELGSITGLAWHPEKNSAAVEKMYIDFIEVYLTEYFKKIKENGKEALISYFKSFDGVCLEDRVQNLISYSIENGFIDQANKFADVTDTTWSSASRVEEVYMQEAHMLALKNGIAATAKQLLQHLTEKGIFNLEFPDSNGIKSKPSSEGFDEWAKEQLEMSILRENELEDEQTLSLPNANLSSKSREFKNKAQELNKNGLIADDVLPLSLSRKSRYE